jgi:UDP-glucuronate 4-epimerase
MKRLWKDGAVLVTGGAGFIGGHLCERLLEDDTDVVCLDAFTEDLYGSEQKEAVAAMLGRSPRFHLLRGDIADDGLLDGIFSAGGISRVVHLAARPGVRPSFADPIDYERVNVRGTLTILETLRRHPTPLVFGSSSSVYGATAIPPFREDDHLGMPVSPYAATKRTAEHFCRVYAQLFSIPIICLRFFTVYGPRNRPDMAAYRFVMGLLRNEQLTLYGDGTARRDFTYVGDTVNGIRAALRWQGRFEIVNVGNSRAVPLSEFIALLEKKTGCRARLNFLPPQTGDVPLTIADTSHAEEVLGFHARVPIEAGLDHLVEWAREKLATERAGERALEA